PPELRLTTDAGRGETRHPAGMRVALSRLPSPTSPASPIVSRVAGSRRATANLLLATGAFALCFTASTLIAPFPKTSNHDLGLNYNEALLLTAVPVILGSLLRVPLGILTDRFGGRIVFSLLLAFSALPAILFGYAHAYWSLLAVGFLLGVAGASFAVGVPFV